MDIGGHRFFSKSDRVMEWWLDVMPMQFTGNEGDQLITYRNRTTSIKPGDAPPDPEKTDRVMLVRSRKSRIYFMRKFFVYPISLSMQTLTNFGAVKTLKVGFSYIKSNFFQIKPERTLEEFLTNRFGRELYATFFESYTEKVWGVPCDKISAAWGAQRVKGLSLWKALFHFISRPFKSLDVSQKGTETSLIERFLYPKLGPGQLWEHVAGLIRKGGGEIHLGVAIDRIHIEGNEVVSVEGVNEAGKRIAYPGDYFFSTMPVRDLIRAISGELPKEVTEVSEGLMYRDFIIVGLLAKSLTVTEDDGSPLKDNWIYIQEPDVAVGRLQIYNNWSPWLVSKPNRVWIGLEYFCNETDPLWKLSNEEMTKLAIEEIARIGILKAEDVEDSHVVHVPKAYPAYFGTYGHFDVIRNYTDSFANLFLVGRNGMHKYNNQDHWSARQILYQCECDKLVWKEP